MAEKRETRSVGLAQSDFSDETIESSELTRTTGVLREFRTPETEPDMKSSGVPPNVSRTVGREPLVNTKYALGTLWRIIRVSIRFDVRV